MTDSNVETVTCEHETWHDDMYPEFAPEPIHETCGAPAIAVLTWHEPGQLGMETITEVLCEEHLVVGVRASLASRWEFVASSFSDAEMQDYLYGQHEATKRQVTDHQFEIAGYEGWLAAGLSAPQPGRQMVGLGWDREMGRRLTEWGVREEERWAREEAADRRNEQRLGNRYGRNLGVTEQP